MRFRVAACLQSQRLWINKENNVRSAIEFLNMQNRAFRKLLKQEGTVLPVKNDACREAGGCYKGKLRVI